MDHLSFAVHRELREVMEADYGLLLDSFIVDSHERLQQLQQACEVADAAALRAAAHSFKGSCANLGALQMAELCRHIELLATQGQSQVQPYLVQLEQAFMQVKPLLAEVRRQLL